MYVVVITGSTGLVGSEAVNFFCEKGFDVIGIDNNLRKFFFGEDGSTLWVKNKLLKSNKKFKNFSVDIRSFNNLNKIFKKYSRYIDLIIHCAAQPSHDYGKNHPLIDLIWLTHLARYQKFQWFELGYSKRFCSYFFL